MSSLWATKKMNPFKVLDSKSSSPHFFSLYLKGSTTQLESTSTPGSSIEEDAQHYTHKFPNKMLSVMQTTWCNQKSAVKVHLPASEGWIVAQIPNPMFYLPRFNVLANTWLMGNLISCGLHINSRWYRCTQGISVLDHWDLMMHLFLF